MGPSAFGQFEGADFENRCYMGFLGGASAFFSCLKSRFCVYERNQSKNSLNANSLKTYS